VQLVDTLAETAALPKTAALGRPLLAACVATLDSETQSALSRTEANETVQSEKVSENRFSDCRSKKVLNPRIQNSSMRANGHYCRSDHRPMRGTVETTVDLNF
jgi:hypothetical protein